MNRQQQRDRHAQTHEPAGGREHRHVHVIEHEHLVAQHGEAIEVLRHFLMRDRPDRRLEFRDVRLERDRHLVAEAALHARRDDAEKPGRRGRHAERNGRESHHARIAIHHAVGNELEPEREQRVGKRRQERQRGRSQHQSRLVAVPELA